MAYQLKLDIYFFSLNKIKTEYNRKHRGKIFKGYKTEESQALFGDYIKSIKKDDNDNYMNCFLRSFIKGFYDSFKTDSNNSKALSITSGMYSGFNSNNYTAWGVFKGGTTGISREVFKTNNATHLAGIIDEDNVTSLPFFYKIWMPKDSNIGLLMVQSYTSIGCTVLFRELLGNFFVETGYKPTWSKCIPNDYIKKYLQNGFIQEIRVLYTKRDEERPLDPLFKPFAQAKRRAIFSNFKMPIYNLLQLGNYQRVLKSQIKAVDANFNEDDDIVILYYENNGKKAHASLASIENILPVITLDDSLMDEKTQIPKWDKLHSFTEGLLETIKNQINYSPKRI